MKFKKKNSHGSTIKSLSSDLLIEIFTWVVSFLFAELFNTKLRYVYNNHTYIQFIYLFKY